MVKFYNPFKWHLIHYDGIYYVRRRSFSLLRWSYADKYQPLKYTWAERRNHTEIFFMDDALEILKLKRDPPRAEVIHGIPD